MATKQVTLRYSHSTAGTHVYEEDEREREHERERERERNRQTFPTIYVKRSIFPLQDSPPREITITLTYTDIKV